MVRNETREILEIIINDLVFPLKKKNWNIYLTWGFPVINFIKTKVSIYSHIRLWECRMEILEGRDHGPVIHVQGAPICDWIALGVFRAIQKRPVLIGCILGGDEFWVRGSSGFNTFLSRHRGDKPLRMGETPRRGLPVLLFLMPDAPLLSSSWIALVRKCSTNCANIHLKAVKILGHIYYPGLPWGKEFACNAGDLGLIPGYGRSPGERNGYSLQYSGLQNSMDRGAWWATVHGDAKSWTWLSD